MAKNPEIPSEKRKVGYKKPPIEHQIKPGEIRNPRGRPSAGQSVTEAINQLVHDGVNEGKLRTITRSKGETVVRRIAAVRLLRAIEAGDIADFEEVLNGQSSLVDARKKGVNTELIKKCKVRYISQGEDEPDITEREIELHDRSGDDFDRILDRTIGKPKQETTLIHDGTLRTTAEGENAGDAILAGLRESLGLKPKTT